MIMYNNDDDNDNYINMIMMIIRLITGLYTADVQTRLRTMLAITIPLISNQMHFAQAPRVNACKYRI